ncbi:hypothetical protein TNCV_3980641, partial [Trichonephila clavipes]
SVRYESTFPPPFVSTGKSDRSDTVYPPRIEATPLYPTPPYCLDCKLSRQYGVVRTLQRVQVSKGETACALEIGKRTETPKPQKNK